MGLAGPDNKFACNLRIESSVLIKSDISLPLPSIKYLQIYLPIHLHLLIQEYHSLNPLKYLPANDSSYV